MVMESLESANQWIKQKGYRLKLCQQREWLYLRGTLPPKPGSDRERAYQQRIALKLPVNDRGVALAKKEADRVGKLLELGLFDWSPYIHQKSLDSVADWVEVLRDDFFARGGNPVTWKTNYADAFTKLPSNNPLSLGLLLKVVKTTEPNTRTRQRVCLAFSRLAKLAEIEPDQIIALRGSYSSRSVDPRTLPSDALIQEWQSQIKKPEWRWCFGMLACYGLRPHELFHCDLKDFPTVRIGEDTKTGLRFVWPLFPEWAEEWELHECHLPKLKNISTSSNRKLGGKISKRFRAWGLVKPEGQTLRPYDLRHSFARRCFEFGFSPELGAKLMGHSVETHTRIYRRWIGEDIYRAAYDMAINSTARPHRPP